MLWARRWRGADIHMRFEPFRKPNVTKVHPPPPPPPQKRPYASHHAPAGGAPRSTAAPRGACRGGAGRCRSAPPGPRAAPGSAARCVGFRGWGTCVWCVDGRWMGTVRCACAVRCPNPHKHIHPTTTHTPTYSSPSKRVCRSRSLATKKCRACTTAAAGSCRPCAMRCRQSALDAS